MEIKFGKTVRGKNKIIQLIENMHSELTTNGNMKYYIPQYFHPQSYRVVRKNTTIYVYAYNEFERNIMGTDHQGNEFYLTRITHNEDNDTYHLESHVSKIISTLAYHTHQAVHNIFVYGSPHHIAL